MEEELGQSGFKGVHKPHSVGGNGLASFYSTMKFSLVKSVTYSFNELLAKLFDLDQFTKQNKYNERVVTFTYLTERTTRKSLVLGIVHLLELVGQRM